MQYLIKFDESGRKGDTYPIDKLMSEGRKQELIEQGFAEVSAEDFKLYVSDNGGSHGTGYIRGIDGKPTDAPPHIPTKTEEAARLYYECENDLKAIESDILQAIAADDEGLLAELREERVARTEQYKKDLKDLEGRLWQE
ncbi:MAG: hypothetical protein J6M62_03635 [Selenomonadaceae bacterium]|nr:hypothetical protein [Selenomonadaceae bacterium]MBO6304158.1 hypothetical protein [Selenomonadaceae bacterium]